MSKCHRVSCTTCYWWLWSKRWWLLSCTSLCAFITLRQFLLLLKPGLGTKKVWIILRLILHAPKDTVFTMIFACDVASWCHILHSIWSNNRFTEWWITMQCSWKSLNNTDNFLQKSMCYADDTPYAQSLTLWSQVDGNEASIYNCHGELCKFLCMCKLLCNLRCAGHRWRKEADSLTAAVYTRELFNTVGRLYFCFAGFVRSTCTCV